MWSIGSIPTHVMFHVDVSTSPDRATDPIYRAEDVGPPPTELLEIEGAYLDYILVLAMT
jgi:hypothetical protein